MSHMQAPYPAISLQFALYTSMQTGVAMAVQHDRSGGIEQCCVCPFCAVLWFKL